MSDKKQDSTCRLPDSFLTDLEKILQDHPEGIREYDLLQILKHQGYFRLTQTRPAPPVDLFQMHFMLFHGLYWLQSKYYRQQTGVIDIHPLEIRLREYSPGENALSKSDKLRDYYLDISNLENMTEGQVNALFKEFWRNYARFDNRTAALSELGLSDPVDDSIIRQEYRRLAMQHHPDRGGEAWRFQAINAAFEILIKNG